MADVIPFHDAAAQYLSTLPTPQQAPVEAPQIQPGYDEAQPSTGITALQAGQVEQGIRPTWGENFMSTVTGAWEHSLVGIPGHIGPVGDQSSPGHPGALVNWLGDKIDSYVYGKSGFDKITAAEANKRYPDMPKPFTEDIYPQIAESRYNEFLRKQKEAAFYARGEPLGAVSGFVAGGLGSAALPETWLMSKTLGIAAEGALGKEAAKKIPSIFAQNFIANAVSESTAGVLDATRQQEAPTPGEVLKSSITGAAIMTGIHVVLGAAGKQFKELTSDVREKIQKKSITQAENNVKIDTKTEALETALRESGLSQDGSSGYRYEPLTQDQPQTVYAAVEKSGGNIPIDSEFGGSEVIHSSDNAQVAENKGEAIQEIRIPKETKLINADEPLSGPEGEKIRSFLEKDSGVKLDDSNVTIRDGLHELANRINSGEVPEAVRIKMNESLKAEGFSGYKYVEDSGQGIKDNRVALFDAPKENLRRYFEADQNAVPKVSDDQHLQHLSESTDQNNSVYNTPENLKTLDDLKEVKDFKTKSEAEQYYNETADINKKFLEASAETNPAIKEELKTIDAEHKQETLLDKAIDLLKNCFIGGY